ncbi:methylamine utilization protein [Aquipseudomonas ullengensis]|uniref:Methylamine utilization protein n=1 Tax=Aquipseudomonas ullengensis TaxID=2759166 RepID=A0A7W4LNQ9_9GAMM|nr:methylamine utilization protein [Pseudomonas ullengensis]MBB2496538.1 methylamine utilization protein [Pseudomonas ullengensis]
MTQFALLVICLALVGQSVHAASLSAELRDDAGRPLGNAVLSLAGSGASAVPAPGIMDQRDKQFAPTVLAVRSGTAVQFPNSDNIRHQVYSFSPTKRFELRLYQGTPSEPVVFDKPGVVVLGCNIHDWMLGYVYVTDDAWFAVSDAAGKLQIDDLPAGTYQATLWHPQSPNMLPVPAGEVNVAQSGAQQRFTLQLVGGAAAAIPTAPKPSAFGDAFKKATREVQQ